MIMAPKKAAKVAPVLPAYRYPEGKRPKYPVNCSSVKPHKVTGYVRKTYGGSRVSDVRGRPIVIATYKRSDPVKGGKTSSAPP